MPFYNKSINRMIGLIQVQMAVTYNDKKSRSELLLDSQKSPQRLVEDLDHVLGTVTLLRAESHSKDERPPKDALSVWLGRNFCPVSNSAISITLKRQGQASERSLYVTSEHLPPSSLPRPSQPPATNASKRVEK